MGVPNAMAKGVSIDHIRPADQAKNSRITSEFVVEFGEVDSRDAIKSYSSGLAAAQGRAGLRLDVPPCLKGSFKILNEHGLSIMKIYGREVKRNIRFDDRNEDLMMDIKLPTSPNWHNITIEQAREAKKMREQLDMQSIRQTALSGGAAANAIDREKARALMLAISPDKETTGNFKSPSGVVHINNADDWRNFEAGQESEDENGDKSVEEILRGRPRT